MFKQITKSFVYRVAYLVGYHTQLLAKIKKNKFVPILSLHRVSPEKNLFWPPLHPYILDELLSFLKKHFEIVTFHELIDAVYKKPKLILSFDDGYYDFIEYAMPILKKHNIKANQNIIPSQLLGENPLWNILFYDFLNAAPLSLIKEIRFLDFDANKLVEKKVSKTVIGLAVSRALKKIATQERNCILKNLHETIFSKLISYPQTRMIRLHEIKDVITEHEIGVHSFSHDSMENESIEYFIEDFHKCKNFFKEHNFPKMDIYAFPNGSYRDEHISYLQKNGIQHILLVNDQYAKHSSPYERLNIAAYDRVEAIFQALGIKSTCPK